ncbi:MAG: hypothetical protein MUF14_08820 [Hyphomonadaceae bacterium]|nr:hypothetical protein [Hyphomonadaceae bacterium]
MLEVLSALVLELTDLPGVYPAISALHVFGIALLVGPVVLVDLAGLRLLLAPALVAAAPSLLRAAGIGLAMTMVSGFFLFAVQPGAYLANPLFLPKLAVIVLGTINGLSWARGGGAGGLPPRWRCAVSILVWPVALLLGRWLAFVE